MTEGWPGILRSLSIFATALGFSSLSMVAIQYYFKRRGYQIEEIMRGPFGFVVTNAFIDNAFKRWWVPVNHLLRDAIWESAGPGDWCG